MVLTCSFARSPDFLRVLEFLSKADDLGDDRFPARNFRLECEVPATRMDRYLGRAALPTLAVDPETSRDSLDYFHKMYVRTAIQSGTRAERFSDTSDSCPDTFRQGCRLDKFAEAGEELDLVRLEGLNFIASKAGWEPDNAHELLSKVGDTNRAGAVLSDDDQKNCRELLDTWQLRSDNRPLFAAFWEDVESALSGPQHNWADELRNRMGLFHYDVPEGLLGRPIPVVAFRYPVRRVPQSSGSKRRLLVRPSVLDGTLNPAFYTAAPRSGVGATVDLVTRDGEPWREVVHPAIVVEPHDVWAVGEIVTKISEPLRTTRLHHSRKLMRKDSDSEFARLCEDLDRDLS